MNLFVTAASISPGIVFHNCCMIEPTVVTIAFYMRLARIFRPKVSLPELSSAQRDEIKDVVNRLRRDGYMILPELLPAQDVEEIKNFAFSTPGFGNDLNKRRVNLSADNIPEGQARFYWWMEELARGSLRYNV